MLWLYRLLFLPAMLVAAPYYLLRMRRRGGYKEGFSQRFGATPPLPAKPPGVQRIWLQAVSVGEMLAIAPILEALKREPRVEVYLTTTTSTGYALAKERYAAHTIGIGYFPMDAWPCSARAWRRIGADMVILTEGERWPEHIHQANARGVRVLCINARLSDRSYRRMLNVRWAVGPLLGGISRVLACSEQDAARFRELGVRSERVQTTGNIKLDVAIPLLSDAERASLREELGFAAGGAIVLGSSTWSGEEAALLNALVALRGDGRQTRLLIVPRHAERRREIEETVQASGLSYHFRSRGPAPRDVEVLVADTTGELRNLAQLATIVFVGKSLPPHHEGQTPVEAAALGLPIVFGPEMSNFREIARELRAADAVRVIHDAHELAQTVHALLDDDSARARMAAAARAWHEQNRGAVNRTLAVLRDELAARAK